MLALSAVGMWTELGYIPESNDGNLIAQFDFTDRDVQCHTRCRCQKQQKDRKVVKSLHVFILPLNVLLGFSVYNPVFIK
jgi:hypothetical protein